MKGEFYIPLLAFISVIVLIAIICHLSFISQINSISSIQLVSELERGERIAINKKEQNEIEKLRVLCLIMTIDSSANKVKTKAIRETWGKRCDKLIFVQNGTYSSNGTYLYANDIIAVPIKIDNRTQLWHKIIGAFTYLYNQHLNEFDWFIKTDDDAYVIPDSLKHFLFHKSSPKESIYFGYRFKPYVKQGYMSGDQLKSGPGYVLSRVALQSLVRDGFLRNKIECNLEKGQVEDVEIGACLEAVGVKAGDTRDAQARPTFLPFSPINLISGKPFKKDHWFYKYAFYGPPEVGRKLCCSNKPIAFHYIEPKLMYLIDWLLYDVELNNIIHMNAYE